jgi:isoprenylcysteine carboxyl methyltransferase (ICMT) family protein YpbQ
MVATVMETMADTDMLMAMVAMAMAVAVTDMATVVVMAINIWQFYNNLDDCSSNGKKEDGKRNSWEWKIFHDCLYLILVLCNIYMCDVS